MKLVELVKIIENNMECVILEVTGTPLDLIKLGCFNGDETMFRLTKGNNHTCTVWTKSGSNFSWNWGSNGYTLVTDETRKKGHLIQECIQEDFEIYIGDNKALKEKTLHIMSLEDVAHNQHSIKLMYWQNGDKDVCCHMDNEFYKHFRSIDDTLKHFEERGYKNEKKENYVAQTGCIVEVYDIIK